MRAPSRARRRAVLAVAVLWVGVLLPLALLVALGWQPLLSFDAGIDGALHPAAVRWSGYVTGLDVVTTAGTSWFRFLVLLPVLVWAALSRRLRLVLLVVVAAASIGPLTSGLKLLVGRHRPEFLHPVYHSDTLSFPSGHSSGIVTLVGLLLVAFLPVQGRWGRRATVVAGALVVLVVGATRVALGAHYPSDVVAGFALGGGWVLLLTAASAPPMIRSPDRGRSSPRP